MLKPTSSDRPLAWHLGGLCVALLVPMLALGGFLLFRMAEAERAQHQGVAREAARQIAIALDRGLTTYQAMLEVLATSDYLRSGNLTAFRQRALDVPRPDGAEIILRDASGQILTETGMAWQPPNSTRPATGADQAATATGRSQISDVLATTPPNFLVVTPVRNHSGDVRYLLGLTVPTSVLSGLLQREEVPDGMVASLADRNGVVAARSTEAARYIGLRLPARLLDEHPRPGAWLAADGVQ